MGDHGSIPNLSPGQSWIFGWCVYIPVHIAKDSSLDCPRPRKSPGAAKKKCHYRIWLHSTHFHPGSIEDIFRTLLNNVKWVYTVKCRLSLVYIQKSLPSLKLTLTTLKLLSYIVYYTSSTAQGGGGSFKNRKPIGEVGCCESQMKERER